MQLEVGVPQDLKAKGAIAASLRGLLAVEAGEVAIEGVEHVVCFLRSTVCESRLLRRFLGSLELLGWLGG